MPAASQRLGGSWKVDAGPGTGSRVRVITGRQDGSGYGVPQGRDQAPVRPLTPSLPYPLGPEDPPFLWVLVNNKIKSKNLYPGDLG